MAEWDVVTLLKEIEKRPEVWNKTTQNFLDKPEKKLAWIEISKNVVGDIKPHEMDTVVKEVMLKWKHLRDCYARNLRQIREQKVTSKGKTIRPYSYAKYLQFMEPVMLNKEITKVNRPSKSNSTKKPSPKKRKWIDHSIFDSKSDSDIAESLIPSFEEYEMTLENTIETKDPLNFDDDSFPEIAEQNDLSHFCNQNIEDDNDDLHFFKSLLPTLKSMSLHKKMTFRIEVMKLVTNYLEEPKS